MDQRGWDSKVNRGIHDIAIDCGEIRLSRLRYAWYDDCVCIKEASRQACALPREGKSRRATALKNTTDFYEGGKLLTWFTSIFVQPELMKQCKACQIRSIYVYRTTTSKISMYDGTKLNCQQAKHLQKWSCMDFTSQNCRILFSLRLY